MSGTKPTEAELEERVQFTVGLMRLMWPKYRIFDAIQAEYQVSRKTAEAYCGRARAKMREEDDTPRIDKRSKVSAFLEDVMGDPDARTRERLRAAREYIKLHGLQDQQPIEEEQTSDIEIVVPDWRSQYKQRLADGEVLSASGNGANGASNGSAKSGNGTKPEGGAE
jgi:hypothetical protein